MDEGDVVSRSTLANATGGETHTLLSEVLDASGQVINPETNVVQRRVVDLGALVGIVGLHDIDFHGHGSLSATQNVLLHVLLRRLLVSEPHQAYLERVEGIETEDVAPEVLEGSLAGSTNSNLLNTQHSVGLSRSEATLLGGS